jgi:hypothetical protein
LANVKQAQVRDTVGIFLARLAYVERGYAKAPEVRDVTAVARIFALLYFAAGVVHAKAAFALNSLGTGGT